MIRPQLVVATIVLALLAAACSDSAGEDPIVAPTTTTEAMTTTAEPTSSTDNSDDSVSAASTPVREQFDWVVGVLNDGGELSAKEAEEHFSPTFLAQVPADQLVASIPQIFAQAEPPYTIERFEADDEGLSAEAVLAGTDNRLLTAVIVVGPDTPNLIEGVRFVPAELEFPTPLDVPAIDERLAAFGPRSSLGLYDVTDGECEVVHEIRPGEAIVLGSVFKLWVLAALGHEIGEGRAEWDDTATVTDELRSNFDGEIYPLETGTEVTLDRLAEAMISVSDNTATDLLLDHLGRDTVEASLERIGIDDPSANVPMLSTGNLFALKFVPDPPNAADYRALDEAGKRALLAELDEAVLPWVGTDVSSTELAESVNADGVPMFRPRDLDVEWFATAEGLCRTLVHLGELAEEPGLERVAQILEINPGAGIPFDRERWPTIRFKGGSEPGVLAGAWWFEGPDGDRYVLAGGVANPDEPVSEIEAVLTIASAIELVD